ncbi:MAG: L-seryl-tRNA(Sec) selenium transferase, partial [Comamonadaceae bacterium]
MIPAVDTLLRSPAFADTLQAFGRPLVLQCLRQLLAEQRARLATEHGAGSVPDEETLVAECRSRLGERARPSLRPVFNLTGTVLHTNLGRALYPQEAIDAAVQAMARPRLVCSTVPVR